MLVCSISMRPPRRAIAAALVETAAAVDASTTGFVVFATLVDDPASVGDIVDAYLGEIMLEVASASDSADAGLAYVTAIDEATTAGAVQDATVGAPAVTSARVLSASRAGLGSVVAGDDGGGKTRTLANVGTVT